MGRIVQLSGVPEVAIDAGRWQPLNERLGISAFGVNGVAMDPGDGADIEHDEADSGHQEVYVVVPAGPRSGSATRRSRPAPATWWPCRTRRRRATTGRSSPGRGSSASAPRPAGRTPTASGSPTHDPLPLRVLTAAAAAR